MADIKWQPVESSNIIEVGYDEDNRELHIRFHSSYEYVYEGVPGGMYQGLLDSDSKGKYLNDNIKGKFDCRKV